jgi:hypothetical protein
MRGISVDFITNTILVTDTFLKAAKDIESEEYIALYSVKADNPNMKVVTKSCAVRGRRNPSKGLTYKYMRKFVSLMDTDNLLGFEKTILYYEGLGFDNITVYQYVRDWFLENYPHHKEMIVDAAPKRMTL